MTEMPHNPLIEDYEDLYENAPCGYLSLLPDGRIVKVNCTFCRWLEEPREDMLYKRFLDLLHITGKIYYETHFAPLLVMQGFFNEVALDLVSKDGRRIPVLVNATRCSDAAGRHIVTRLTIFNATERRRYERELLQARATAEAARAEAQRLASVTEATLLDERAVAALREQFIAVLGHDLRNPLAAIEAGMRLLAKAPLDDKGRDIVAKVQSTTARMGSLIEDIMDLARGRLGAGLDIHSKVLPIEPVLRQVIGEIQTAHPERRFDVQISDTIILEADPGRIAQLLSNLLGNAVTHGDPNYPVRVCAIVENSSFHLSVANSGDPIPPDVLVRIFEPFTRGSRKPQMQGLGLGLYICNQIALAHKGSIEASSDPEETRFTFRMQAKIATAAR